jgi:hypothetical protein
MCSQHTIYSLLQHKKRDGLTKRFWRAIKNVAARKDGALPANDYRSTSDDRSRCPLQISSAARAAPASRWSMTLKATGRRRKNFRRWAMLARSIIGSPDTVCSDMDALIAVTGADKLLILSDVYGHATRPQSFIVGTGGIPANFDHSRSAQRLIFWSYILRPTAALHNAISERQLCADTVEKLKN